MGDLQGNPRRPNLGDFAGAIASYEKANRIRRGLPDTAEHGRLLADNYRGQGDIRHISFDLKGALDDYGAALKTYEDLLAKDPASHQHDLAVVQMYFGNARYRQRDWQGALRAYQKTADYSESVMQADEKNLWGRRNLALALRSIGFTHKELGDRGKPGESFRRAVELLTQLKAHNSLSGWDELMIEEMERVLRSL